MSDEDNYTVDVIPDCELDQEDVIALIRAQINNLDNVAREWDVDVSELNKFGLELNMNLEKFLVNLEKLNLNAVRLITLTTNETDEDGESA